LTCLTYLYLKINDHPNLRLVAEYNNAIETKNGLLETKVDLIFLDIEMPILSGFDLLDDLIHKPQIIFVTGKTKYAYKAFNYNAIDYLRKPITKDRFTNAVYKAISLHKLRTEGAIEDDDYIFVKSNLKKKKVILNELKYITALGDYVKLVTVHDPIIVLATMKSFVAQLPPERFMRIHKSYIINIDKVDKYKRINRTLRYGATALKLNCTRSISFFTACNDCLGEILIIICL